MLPAFLRLAISNVHTGTQIAEHTDDGLLYLKILKM